MHKPESETSAKNEVSDLSSLPDGQDQGETPAEPEPQNPWLKKVASDEDDVYELQVTVTQEGETAVDILAARTHLSKARIKEAMTKGAVWIKTKTQETRLRRAKTVVRVDNILSIYYSRKVLDTKPLPATPVHTSSTYSVWIKPAGMMSSGSRFGDHGTIDRWVETTTTKKTFLVHRLDRFTSGLILLAHTKASAAHFSQQFQEKEVRKIYRAIVHGNVQRDSTVTLPIEDKHAVSHINPIEHRNDKTLVEINIETGRKHQIRIHLSHIGHPISGDRQYGSPDTTDLQLAAVELEFLCPDTSERITLKLPDALCPAFDELGPASDTETPL